MMKCLHYRTSQAASTLNKVLHLSTLIAADMARFEERTGLTSPRVQLLWALGVAGPSNHRALAQALGVTPRNVTGLVDGLVDSGHITREPHPTDRRANLVTPTDRGLATIHELRESHDHLAPQLFGETPDRQLATFSTTLDETIVTFQRLMDEDQ